MTDQYSNICVTWALSADELWGTYKKMVKIYTNNWKDIDLTSGEKVNVLYRTVHGKTFWETVKWLRFMYSFTH